MIQQLTQSTLLKLNIIILGDVDSGKSTLIELLIQHFEDNFHDKKPQNLLENDIDIPSQPKMYLDKFKDENERGEIQNSSYLLLNSQNYEYIIIDVPGHKDFIKNMIIGKSRLDAALFFISALHGEFEYSFSQQGLIKAQIVLAQNLGLQQIIFIINKMDDKFVNYSKERFEEIVQQVKEFLNSIKFYPILLRFVPTSGFYGDNLFYLSPKMSWYTEKYLIKTFSELSVNDISINQPLRLPIIDVYKIGGVGVVPVGTVTSGILKPGMQIYFSPCDILNEIKYFEMTSYSEARVGDRMGFSLTKQISVKDLKRGHVCSDAQNDPAKQCQFFDALVSIIEAPQPIQNGYSANLFCHTAKVVVQLEKIYCKLNRRTGQIIEQESKNLYSGDSAIVKIQPTQPLCIEKFSQYPKLGRFIIKNLNKIEIVGIIIKVEKCNTQINIQ